MGANLPQGGELIGTGIVENDNSRMILLDALHGGSRLSFHYRVVTSVIECFAQYFRARLLITDY